MKFVVKMSDCNFVADGDCKPVDEVNRPEGDCFLSIVASIASTNSANDDDDDDEDVAADFETFGEGEGGGCVEETCCAVSPGAEAASVRL